MKIIAYIFLAGLFGALAFQMAPRAMKEKSFYIEVPQKIIRRVLLIKGEDIVAEYDVLRRKILIQGDVTIVSLETVSLLDPSHTCTLTFRMEKSRWSAFATITRIVITSDAEGHTLNIEGFDKKGKRVFSKKPRPKGDIASALDQRADFLL